MGDPAIFIFDEATSAFDRESEWLIQSALAALHVNRTAFIVAHRLSTIRQCDRIHVIEADTVIESGGTKNGSRAMAARIDAWLS